MKKTKKPLLSMAEMVSEQLDIYVEKKAKFTLYDAATAIIKRHKLSESAFSDLVMEIWTQSMKRGGKPEQINED